MAGCHAALSCTSREVTIGDLDSPGGTFVNRQRLLSGQSRRLEPGDVIQLGSIQLRLTNTAATDVAGPLASPVTKESRRSAVGPGPAVPPIAAAKTSATITPPTSHRPPASGPLPAGQLLIPFTMAEGLSCRSWNDFLVVAAQHWGGAARRAFRGST